MKQIPFEKWPRGLRDPVALIEDRVIEDLDLTYDAYWEDGLGLHFIAMFETDAGPMALRRGSADKGWGTNLLGMEDGALVEPRIQAFLDLFELDESVVLWRTPNERALDWDDQRSSSSSTS